MKKMPASGAKKVIAQQAYSLLLDKPVFKLNLSKEEIRDLSAKYPKKCGNCGFDRFQHLKYARYSIGSEATFQCPNCQKQTKTNTNEKW